MKIIQSLNLISRLYFWCLFLLKDFISGIRNIIRLSLLLSGLKQRVERLSDSVSDNQQKAAAAESSADGCLLASASMLASRLEGPMIKLKRDAF